jgi:hypothetical protein
VGSSLLIEGRMLQAQLLLREPKDPDLRGATAAASGGGEPLMPQGSARPKGMGGPDPKRRRDHCRHPLSLAWQR